MKARTPVLAALLGVLTGLLAASPAPAAPVSVGHSGWTWGDPLPQGETLNRVVFLGGARGYAVGANGTVLRTDDGGHTWIGLASGTSADLSLAQEVEPNVVVVGGGCSLRSSTDAGATFHRVPINESESSCAQKVASFSFLSPTTGFVEQSDGSIFVTSDGGQTVEPRTAVPLGGAPAGPIAFVSPTVGLAVVGNSIYRTADGANSWTKVASESIIPPGLADLTFVTPTLAYAVGSADTFLKSTDAGETWSRVPFAFNPAAVPYMTHVSCGDAAHCLMTTGEQPSPELVRWIEGEPSPTLVSPAEVGLTSVAFSTGSNVVAVGVGGAIVLSTDGGATFQKPISRRLGAHLTGPIRTGQAPLDAYAAAGVGQILATVNGGESWSQLHLPTSATVTDVAFPTPSVGYAVNEAGTVYRSPSAGLSWSILGANAPAPAALLAPDQSTVLLVGPLGVRRSTNSGASFAPVSQQLVVGRRRHRPVRKALTSIALEGADEIGATAVAYGSQLIESTNGGATWKAIPTPLAHRRVEGVSFVSASAGYAASGGRLFFTADAGLHWREDRSLGSRVSGTLAFSTASEGYVLVPGRCEGCNLVAHTADGGRSWTPELLPRTLESLADAPGAAYAAGVEGSGLFATRDGGLNPTASTLSLAISGARTLTKGKLLHKQHGVVRLAGKLAPALGGETIELAYRSGNGSWHRISTTAASSGAFAFTVSGIGSSTDFVAQWQGAGPVSGAGTPVAHLAVTAPKQKKGKTRK